MTLSKFLTSAAVAALLTGAASAQDTTTESGTGTATGTEQSTGMSDTGTGTGMTDTSGTYAEGEAAAEAPKSIEEMTVGQVIGRSVVDPEGNTIGEIDYVIEQPEGVAGVIGIGGFLGLGEYTVAIQMDEFEYSPEETTLMLDTDKETLKERPEFDESIAAGQEVSEQIFFRDALQPPRRIADAASCLSDLLVAQLFYFTKYENFTVGFRDLF